MISNAKYIYYPLVITSVFLLCCGVLALFAPFYWIFDILSSFVPQYTLLGGLLAFLLLLTGKHRIALLMLFFAMFNAWQMYMFWKKDEPANTKNLYEQVSLLQFNVTKTNPNTAEIATWLIQQSHDLDIIVLFGVNKKWNQELGKLEILYPYHYRHSLLRGENVAVFSKIPVKQFRNDTLRNMDAPMILADMKSSKYRISWLLGIVQAALPFNEDTVETRNNMLETTAKRLQLNRQSAVTGNIYQERILIGDMSLTPWSPSFRRILDSSQLRDAQNGKGLMGTWPVFMGAKFGLPVDHTLVSRDIRVMSREVGPAMGSSHFPVITTFGIPVTVEPRK